MTTIYFPVVSRSDKPVCPFGVQVDAVWPVDVSWQLPYVVPGGNLLLNIWWSKNEVVRGQIEYEPRFVNQMEHIPDNTFLILSVKAAPEWARNTGIPACGPIKEDAISPLCDFIERLLTDYPMINAVEFGNETSFPYQVFTDAPDCGQFGCWGSSANYREAGRYYGQVAKAVCQRVKAIRPDVLFIGFALGFLGTGDLEFLDGALEVFRGFDAISFHQYFYTVSPDTWEEKLNADYQALRVHTDLPLWMTETNWQSAHPELPENQDKQAEFIDWLASRGENQFQKILFYNMAGNWKGCYLIEMDGTKRPAWYAYERAINGAVA